MKRLLVLLVLVACANQKSNKLPAEAWGVDDYAAAGLKIDQPWVAADFTNAAAVLEQVSAGHRERLPRYQGPKSGAVFAKLIGGLPPDADRPLVERFGAHVEVVGAVNQIMHLYSANDYAAQTREWIEITGAVLREATLLANNADAVLAAFGPDDPSHEVRVNGLAKMRSGYGQMLLGGLMLAGDTRVSEVDRTAIVKHVTAALPALFPTAPAETQTHIRDQVKLLVDKLPKGALRDAVIEAQQALP